MVNSVSVNVAIFSQQILSRVAKFVEMFSFEISKINLNSAPKRIVFDIAICV